MASLPAPGSSDVWGTQLNTAIESLHLGPDTHANRPTTGLVKNTLYSCTDHGLIYRWSGSAWATYATVDNPVATRVRVQPSADQTIGNGTFTVLSHGVEEYDPAGLHSTTTNPDRITFDRTGLWLVSASAVWGAESAVGRRIVSVIRYDSGGVSLGEVCRGTNFPNMAQTLDASAHAPVVANPGEYVIMRVYQDSGSGVTLTAAPSYFAVTFLGK